MAESIIKSFQEWPYKSVESVTTITTRGASYTVLYEGMAFCTITATAGDGRFAQVYINGYIALGIGGDTSVSIKPTIARVFRVHPGDVITTRDDLGSYSIQISKYV